MSMREARLEVIDPLDRRVVPLNKDVFEIGRREGSDLRLADTDVSRNHAQILRDGGRFTLKDHASLHGTFVNGERTSGRVLEHGDRIQFGRNRAAEVVFRTDDVQTEQRTAAAGGDLRQIAMLLEKLRALGSGRVLDEVLALVLDSALDLTGADRGFIMLADADRRLEFKLARARGGVTLSGRTFETSRKIPEDVFATGRQAIVEDLLDAELAPLHTGTVALGIRHVLCTPLRLVHYVERPDEGNAERAGKQVIGVLYLDSRHRGMLGSASITSALETLGAEAALAIENARLYREALEKAKFEQELKVAAAFQQALLPASSRAGTFVTTAATSIPCRAIGGDFFDYAELPTGQFGFIVGDVTGKGAAAALLAAAMLGMFSAEARHRHSAASLITALNRGLFSRTIEARFLTAFYGMLGADGSLTYSNAGHNAPVLLTEAGMGRLEKGGVVLGVFEDAVFEQDVLALRPGDVIVAFSDGVTEARNQADEEFADERLVRVVAPLRGESPQAIVDAVAAAVRAFCQDATLVDDLTIVAVRYEG
ncbi:MAG: hypothetical protein A3H95_02690 [Acidobacteria bacterium RIFCSPLOWO2_02_FULL_64_15]|nr:MAG: hypothetical protein A3H95_02690 [Acidobacteria bacterium RIFCSPLOWO2_02_FULL_64_15]